MFILRDHFRHLGRKLCAGDAVNGGILLCQAFCSKLAGTIIAAQAVAVTYDEGSAQGILIL